MAYRDSQVHTLEGPEYMRAACATDPGPGALVYVDNIVAGWRSIAPRATYRRLLNSRTIPELDDRDAWIAVCFVVRSGYRRRGLMHHLLASAFQHAAARGAEVVESYPAEAGGSRIDVISGYVGSVDLFERAGFERAAPTTGRSGGQPGRGMRKSLR